MGSSSSNTAAPPLLLPQQEVVALSAGHAQRAAGRVPPELGRGLLQQHVPAAEHFHAGQVRINGVWDRHALELRRAEGAALKHVWLLSAQFSARAPCEFSAHFHCRGKVGPNGMEYVPAAEGAPPSFSRSYPAGKHTVTLEKETAIDLQKWPLEVFWRYKQKSADVVPIAFVLTTGDEQSLIHLTLDVPRGGGAPRCTLLQQKVVVGGKEYALQEVYGLAELGKDESHDETTVNEPCVICLTDRRSTAIKPCMHLCVCGPCGAHLQAGAALRQDRCPICRGPIEGLQVFDVEKTETAG